jgi:hypothetical protein
MGNPLLVIPESDAHLEKDELKNALLDIPGVYGFVYRPEAFLTCYEAQFGVGDEETVIELESNGQAISFEDICDQSLFVALEIQKRIRTPLRAGDASCGFEIPLKEIHSLAEFRERIQQESDKVDDDEEEGDE